MPLLLSQRAHLLVLVRGSAIASWLWSGWLCLPQQCRAITYRIFIRLAGEETISPHALRLPFGLYAKFCYQRDEALVTEYVRTRTTIPVPTILDHISVYYRRRECWLTLMTALPGEPLLMAGKGSRLITATDEQVTHIQHVLTDWISQLRGLPPPHLQRVCGFLGGVFKSYRIGYDPVGPFDSPAEFHSQYFCTAYPDYPDEADEGVKRLIVERPHKSYKIHLTHGDLLPHNILADDAYRPTGLIDWECAGWMPEYWETASSFRSAHSRAPVWKDIVRESFPKYDDDMSLEWRIQLWYDP